MINLALRKDFPSLVSMLLAVFGDWETETEVSVEGREYLTSHGIVKDLSDNLYHEMLWSSWDCTEAERVQRAYEMYSKSISPCCPNTEYQIQLDDNGKVEALAFVIVD